MPPPNVNEPECHVIGVIVVSVILGFILVLGMIFLIVLFRRREVHICGKFHNYAIDVNFTLSLHWCFTQKIYSLRVKGFIWILYQLPITVFEHKFRWFLNFILNVIYNSETSIIDLFEILHGYLCSLCFLYLESRNMFLFFVLIFITFLGLVIKTKKYVI